MHECELRRVYSSTNPIVAKTISWSPQRGRVTVAAASSTFYLKEETLNGMIEAGILVLAPDCTQISEVRYVAVTKPASSMPDLPRLWSLFRYALPRRVQERVFEPAHQEMLEDFLLARKSYRTKWARRWLVFAFTFRTVLMVLGCLWELLKEKPVQFFLGLLPESLKLWWLLRR